MFCLVPEENSGCIVNENTIIDVDQREGDQ